MKEEKEKEIINLKAQAFDLIGLIQEAEKRLKMINEKINILYNEINIEKN